MDNNPSLEQVITSHRARIHEEVEQLLVSIKYVQELDATGAKEDRGEVIANMKLSMRHLEDAAMRLGKVFQAMNGGVSNNTR